MQSFRAHRIFAVLFSVAVFLQPIAARAQNQPVSQSVATPESAPVQGSPIAPVQGSPIAVVPLENGNGGATVTGALEVTAGKAIITASGSVTSGSHTTDVALPRRGTLRVCASTTVKLASDSSASAGEVPGLLMAMDQGAVEMSFATIQNADILLTPDFRILIGGPGSSEVKVRLGANGDTCVDNPGVNAPYVVVSSLFGDGIYRVQPGQRVMFQHGNPREVVDQEKEPCGCPPQPAAANGNEFPLAQSEGLAPMPAAPIQESAAPQVPAPPQGSQVPPLVYTSPAVTPQTAKAPDQESATPQVPATPQVLKKKQPNIFTRFGRFLKRIFGAE